ncbi:MAG: 4-hydroxybenzoate octaprenyltransferase [Hyphomonadaceae bacterium]
MTDRTSTSEPAQEAAHTEPTPVAPADAVASNLIANLPERAKPFLSMARIDRPIGIWLLALPCWIGLAFMAIPEGLQWIDIWWAVLFGIGAVAMRGAGCTWNDITDREIDAKVARTANRPIPSGQVTLRDAYIFLAGQVFVGFLVWLCLPTFAKIVAVLAIPLVAAYPYMKRITYWPQAWLGLTFNWGILVAAATVGNIGFAVLVLFSSMAIWTIAYDTIYALQDREDDALIGVKSTARLFGDHAIMGAFVFHLGATAQMALAAYLMGAGRVGALAGILFLTHGLWQSARLKRSKGRDALAVFKSNAWAGAIVLSGFLIAAMLA